MPLFAHEVIAFQVAIFLTLFPGNNHCGRCLTAVEVAALLSEAAKGLYCDDTLQPNCNFYINPIALHQGFRIFKGPLQSTFGIEFTVINHVRMESFYEVENLKNSLSVTIRNKEMGQERRQCVPQLKGHLSSLLTAIKDKRNLLLKTGKLKDMNESAYDTQDQVLSLGHNGKLLDKRPQLAQITSSPTVVLPARNRGICSFKEKAPRYQNGQIKQLETAMLQYLVDSSNFTGDDAHAIIDGTCQNMCIVIIA